MTDSDLPGSLDVRTRVVTRIAEIAAGRVTGVEHVAGGLTSRALPRAEATVNSGRIRATVEAAAKWPTPIVDVATRIRIAVSEDLAANSGLDVDIVDVRVHYIAPQDNSSSSRRNRGTGRVE
jgi:uncharacterized alkaline shock family protein YloU